MNDRVEQELRRALQRVPAPDGFSDRVMARLPAPSRSASAVRWLYMAAAAMAVIALLFGGVERTRRVREYQARRAEEQVVFALSLAAEKLQKVNTRLERSGPEVRLEQKQGKQYE